MSRLIARVRPPMFGVGVAILLAMTSAATRPPAYDFGLTVVSTTYGAIAPIVCVKSANGLYVTCPRPSGIVKILAVGGKTRPLVGLQLDPSQITSASSRTGVSASFAPNPAGPGYTKPNESNMSIGVQRYVPRGTYTVRIVGASTSLFGNRYSQNFTVTVQ